MAWIWAVICTTVVFLWVLNQQLKKKKKNHPPGPIGIPILGHFHLLGKNPHQDLHHLAQTHGPIMYLRFGFVPTVVVSSPAGAELVLKTHDLVLAGRPRHQAAKHLSYDGRNILFAQYGPYWRNMRKLCTLQLLSNLKINQFQAMRKGEVSLLVDSLRSAGERREIVDLSERISALSGDMICLMVFGRKYADSDLGDESGFKFLIEEALRVAALPNLGDFFPLMGVLDLQGLNRRMKKLSTTFDGFLERIIDDHLRPNNDPEKKKKKEGALDFVDTMMGILESGEAGFEFDRRHVKAVLLDMLVGGTDTSSTAVNWAMAEIIRHPRIMKKLQKELEQVVGMDQHVEESHLHKLGYLDLVLKETFRVHPVVPFFIHEAMEDCTLNQFHISKGSRIILNVWSIGKDPNVWQDPEKFSPERFLDSDADFGGHDFKFLPFGSGRRACPGSQLGLTMVRLVVAQLVHCFDWELPHGMGPEDIDMTEHFGLVTGKDKHLMAIPLYRLHA